jgi:hypothetical protein
MSSTGEAGVIQTMTKAVRTLEERRLTRKNHFGALLAILTCPCHAGALLVLTSGTAFGGVLTAYSGWLYGALGASFAAGLWLLFRRDRAACDRCA